MAEIVINSKSYTGGAGPFIGSVHKTFNTTQVSLNGFTTDDATIEVLPTGASGWKTVVVDTAEYAVIIPGSIDKFRISDLAEGSYSVSAIQWNS